MNDVNALIDAIEPTKWTRVKTHIRENKAIYIGTTVGVAGVATGVILGRRIATQTVVQGIAINSPVTLTQVVELARRHNPGKVIRDTETGEVYASIRRTAAAIGKTPKFVRDNLDTRFEFLGEAT